jgi:hypothetical protein
MEPHPHAKPISSGMDAFEFTVNAVLRIFQTAAEIK